MNISHFLWFPPALKYKDVCVNVLHTNPAWETQSSVCPNPVHYGPQLSQEWNQPEPESETRRDTMLYWGLQRAYGHNVDSF